MGPKQVPPCLQSGERLLPARALPVPFCLNGLTPPPLTSALFFVAAVPARLLASWFTTAACIRWGLTSVENNPGRSTSFTFLLFWSTIATDGISIPLFSFNQPYK